MSFHDLAPPTPCCADAWQVVSSAAGVVLVLAALLV